MPSSDNTLVLIKNYGPTWIGHENDYVLVKHINGNYSMSCAGDFDWSIKNRPVDIEMFTVLRKWNARELW